MNAAHADHSALTHALSDAPSSDFHSLPSDNSSPIKAKNILASSPPFRPADYNESSPERNSRVRFNDESTSSPTTPAIPDDDDAMSDSSITPTRPAFIPPGAATFLVEDRYPLKDEFLVPSSLLNLTEDDIKNDSAEGCKEKLVDAAELLRQATNTIQKFKSLVSQMKLQNQLLTIETHESAQRFEVENNLVKREVDRLRYEQIDHQHSIAVAVETRFDSDTYRRRLQRAKLKLKDANREIEERDIEIARIKKRLREGRLHREALELALLKGKEAHNMEVTESTPPPRGSFYGPGASIVSSAPQPSKRSDIRTQQNGESGLDALGFLASQALIEQQQMRSQGSESPEKAGPSLARFGTKQESINLPPLRLSELAARGSNRSNGLMSPVAFKEGPFSAESSPPPANTLLPGQAQASEKRRHSNASTITVPSDNEDSRPRSEARGASAANPDSEPTHLPSISSSSNGDKAPKSPRKRPIGNRSMVKSPSRGIIRSGSGNLGGSSGDRSPRTPPR